VNEAAKQTVLRPVPYGLHAVTVRRGDEDHGITAAWVMQAAFAPPMVAVAVENDSKGLPMIRDARAFAVNVLGLPVLAEAVGWIESRLVATMPAGSHTPVLGEVMEAGVERTGTAPTLAESGLKYSV